MSDGGTDQERTRTLTATRPTTMSARTVFPPQRVVLAKVGLDGHDRGIKVIARGLRDAGFHVIYAGIWQSPEAVAQAVADEDADWLGISLLNGAHMELVPRVLQKLREFDAAETGVMLGGIIPASDALELKQLGVASCYGPGTQIAEIVASLAGHSKARTIGPVELIRGCQRRDRKALSQLLTRLAHDEEITALRTAIQQETTSLPRRTIAFTGSPGVGKSTLIARLLTRLRKRNHSVAVLSCDPQSPLTGGALLGDRIRMADSLPDKQVFIRSLATPSGSQGIAANLDLMSRALRLFGFDVVLIETVGVGQGDVAIREHAGTVIAVLQPESGDSVQWEKAGLLEIADAIAINKSDLPGAERLIADLQQQFTLPGSSNVPLISVSATDESGPDKLLDWLLDKSDFR